MPSAISRVCRSSRSLRVRTLRVRARRCKTEHVEAELVAERTARRAGPAVDGRAAAARSRTGWHTYWRNPGDSGLPTTLAWTLPPGFTAGAIEWPAPHALPAGPLVNYGYEGEVLHLRDADACPPMRAPARRVTLAGARRLARLPETCIPEGADLTLALPVAATRRRPTRSGRRAIAATRAALPQPLRGWTRRGARATGATIALTLRAAGRRGAIRATLHFFPIDEGRIEPSAPQTLARDAHGALRADAAGVEPARRRLHAARRRARRAATGFGATAARARRDDRRAARRAPSSPGPSPKLDAAPALNVAPARRGERRMSLAAGASLLAFVGGLILNLMPCVFPVLSLKALSLAAPGHDDRARRCASQGLAFARRRGR